VTKTAARRAAPAPAAKARKAAAPARKSSAKVAPKPAPKAAARSAAKPAPRPAAKTASKPVAKSAAGKTAAHKAHKAPKAPARPAAKAASKPAAGASRAAAAPAKAAAKPTPQPATKATPKLQPPVTRPSSSKSAPDVKAAPAKPAAKSSSRAAPAAVSSTPRATAAMAAAPEPNAAAASAAARFTDRFAPAAPRARATPVAPESPRVPVKADPKLANAWKTKAGHELTEDEILAMPDSEYMNDKQLEFFRARLQKLKDDLLSNAGETTEHLREDTSIVPDPADRATIEEEHALELRTRDRERKLLKKIAQSLARIDSGDYGFCDETGEPIGLGRLLARPTATLSLEAQQRREMKQRMFGD